MRRSTRRQFEQTLGMVENIDTTSRQLKDALESGQTIIVTTLQKFPVIAKEIGEMPGTRFALIEEGFILDVLACYTTYTAHWRLLKKVKDDPRFDKRKAEYLLKSFVELHSHAIGEKVAICVEHFASKVQGEIFGRAKAMIVTRSRMHAVRYWLAVDKYLSERGYPFKALAAFSGTVKAGGRSYTETGMNGFPGAQIAKAFERTENRILIVANEASSPTMYASIPSSPRC